MIKFKYKRLIKLNSYHDNQNSSYYPQKNKNYIIKEENEIRVAYNVGLMSLKIANNVENDFYSSINRKSLIH